MPVCPPDGDRKAPVILQLVPALNEGGVERGALEITEAIVGAGGRALIASAGGRMERRLRHIGGELIRLPLDRKDPVSMFRNARHLMRLIREENIDLIHARSRGPAWSGLFASRRTGTPFVTTYHGAYNEGEPGKRLYNSVMARGKPVIAVSDFISTLIQRRHYTDPSRIITIPRGADLSYFSPDKVKPDRLAALVEEWRLDDESRPIIMLPGRLTRWKGQEIFIEACRIVKERCGPDAFLGLIVGSAKAGSVYSTMLDKQIEKSDVADCVKITGACKDMPAAYTMAQCVVSASTDPEAFGRIAVEAQAMGRPVIATDHGGGRETVEHDKTGLLVKPADAEGLAGAIENILEIDEPMRNKIGRDAIDRVRKSFSVDRMKSATLDVYERETGIAFPSR